jgi:hypothetical protein
MHCILEGTLVCEQLHSCVHHSCLRKGWSRVQNAGWESVIRRFFIVKLWRTCDGTDCEEDARVLTAEYSRKQRQTDVARPGAHFVSGQPARCALLSSFPSGDPIFFIFFLILRLTMDGNFLEDGRLFEKHSLLRTKSTFLDWQRPSATCPFSNIVYGTSVLSYTSKMLCKNDITRMVVIHTHE